MEKHGYFASQGNDSNDANPEFQRGLRLGLQIAFPHLEFPKHGLETGPSNLLVGEFSTRDVKTKSVNYPTKYGFARKFRHNKVANRRNQKYHGPYQQNPRNGRNQVGSVWITSNFGSNQYQGGNNNSNNGGNHGTWNIDNTSNSGAQSNGNGEKGQGELIPLCGRCNKNHYGPNCPYKNPNCFNCNKPGHISKNCPVPRHELGSNRLTGIWKGLSYGQK